jgi:hypothetical protein
MYIIDEEFAMFEYDDFNYNEDYDEDEIQEEFQKFRSEALAFCVNKDKSIVEAWCAKIGYKYPLGYHNNRCDRVFELYTNHPGVCIGKAGSAITEFKEMLKAEFKVPYEVKLIEIRGDFANIG